MAISRDYTKEVGIASTKKNVPRPIAFAILALLAVGIFFGVNSVMQRGKTLHAAEKNAGAAASP